MQDSINRYHILIYRNYEEVHYEKFNDIEKLFECYLEYVGLEQCYVPNEHIEFIRELDMVGNFYCESYAHPEVITAFVIDVDKFELSKELDDDVSNLEHDNIHIDLFKRINRSKSLKSLLDG